jgi:aspartyl-tRNA(Asn)/glutamyl-tRNA(Gln) amidotransferase subunit A
VSGESVPALLTVQQAQREIRERRISAVELTDAAIRQVERLNPTLRAFISTDFEAALEQARGADGQRDKRVLEGIPICIKDIIDVEGFDTTAGAAHWRRTPKRDADAVARLRAAGAVIIGKGHTNEFAYGIDGMNPHWGNCLNPHDTSRLSGGSSSGPAVATATGMSLAGLGSDTTGSIRVPASFCGLVGVRPTPGVHSLDGIIPLAWSYDTVGPLTRTVADAEILLEVLTPPQRWMRERPSPANLRVGLLDQLLDSAEEYVATAVLAAAHRLESVGGAIGHVHLATLEHANAVHQIIQHAEAAAAHRPWFAAERANYSQPVRERIEAGTLLPAAVYLTAQRARRLLVDEAAQKLGEFDVLLAPTTPLVAPPQDVDEITIRGTRHPLRPGLLSCVLGPTELGCPIVSVPVGSHDGLPFGMQVIGRPGSERLLLAVAQACEEPFSRT